VAIDPAVSNNENSDETGIIVAGRADDGHAYVIADYSGKFSPDGWAREAIKAYHRHQADRVIAEVNNGGALLRPRCGWLIPTSVTGPCMPAAASPYGLNRSQRSMSNVCPSRRYVSYA